MSSKREALLGRFRARSLVRVRRLVLVTQAFESGDGSPDIFEEAGRELHTLKGDARVVGLEVLSELLHSAEELFQALRPGSTPGPEVFPLLGAAFDVVERVLKEELVGPEAEGQMRAVQASLGVAPAAAPRDSQPAEPAPREEAPDSERSAGDSAPRASERWIQVRAERVEQLFEQVTELSVDFHALTAHLTSWESASASAQTHAASMRRGLLEGADRCLARLNDLTSAAWSLRLVPVGPTFDELAHDARAQAKAQGKALRVVVRGEGAELERSIIDALREPLMHLVRNAVDHGVEPSDERGEKELEATLTLNATSLGAHLQIEVSDDGRGIDVPAVREKAVSAGLVSREAAGVMGERELIDFIFVHGFSTRSTVSETSGRGVGLDVVRDQVESLGGTVSVFTERGQGTLFQVKVPATLSKERTLVTRCGGILYGFPAVQVQEVVRLGEAQVRDVAGGQVLSLRGETIPLRSMGRAVGHPSESEPLALLLDAGGRRWAFSIPALVGEREVLRRPVDALLGPLGHVSASAVLDDGALVLLVSVAGLLKANLAVTPRHQPSATHSQARRVLVVDDSPTVRDLVCEILSEGGLAVQSAEGGAAALAALSTGLPDAVLSDLDMPGMDGFELLRKIRGQWPHLPVILLTTRGSAEDRRQAVSLGADAYLVKSEFRDATLLDTVKRFIGRGRA